MDAYLENYQILFCEEYTLRVLTHIYLQKYGQIFIETFSGY